MKRYGVTATTANRAFEVLQSEGLVVAKVGSGVYVQRFARVVRRSPGRLATAHRTAGQSIQDHDTGLRQRQLDVVVGYVPAPEAIASLLGAQTGELVLSRSRRFVVDDRPVQLATSFLPTALTRGTSIEHTDPGTGGIYARLAEQGLAPTVHGCWR